MSMVKCRECKGDVSSSASKCPHCGIKNPGVGVVHRIGIVVVLGLIAAAIFGEFSDGNTPATTQVAKNLADYSIVTDRYDGSISRKVEVALKEHLTEAQLRDLANAIKATAQQQTDITHIGYRVDGQADKLFWATTRFDPELSVSVMGLSADEYQKLQKFDVTHKYQKVVGVWLRDDFGDASCLIVAYEHDGSYFIGRIFADGSGSDEKMKSRKQTDGSIRLEEPDADRGEHYIIDTAGNLQGWNSEGNYLTLPPRKAPLKS